MLHGAALGAPISTYLHWATDWGPKLPGAGPGRNRLARLARQGLSGAHLRSETTQHLWEDPGKTMGKPWENGDFPVFNLC